MSYSVVPPADIRVMEVPHEDQGLQTRGWSYLSVDGLIQSFSLVRWPVADTLHLNLNFFSLLNLLRASVLCDE